MEKYAIVRIAERSARYETSVIATLDNLTVRSRQTPHLDLAVLKALENPNDENINNVLEITSNHENKISERDLVFNDDIQQIVDIIKQEIEKLVVDDLIRYELIYLIRNYHGNDIELLNSLSLLVFMGKSELAQTCIEMLMGCE